MMAITDECNESINEREIHMVVCGLEKDHTSDHLAIISWGIKNHSAYIPEKFIFHADIIMRLTDEIKSLENYLMNHGTVIPPNSKRNISLRLIELQKILNGDKPDDDNPKKNNLDN